MHIRFYCLFWIVKHHKYISCCPAAYITFFWSWHIGSGFFFFFFWVFFQIIKNSSWIKNTCRIPKWQRHTGLTGKPSSPETPRPACLPSLAFLWARGRCTLRSRAHACDRAVQLLSGMSTVGSQETCPVWPWRRCGRDCSEGTVRLLNLVCDWLWALVIVSAAE